MTIPRRVVIGKRIGGPPLSDAAPQMRSLRRLVLYGLGAVLDHEEPAIASGLRSGAVRSYFVSLALRSYSAAIMRPAMVFQDRKR
jgi:hypothetical protein